MCKTASEGPTDHYSRGYLPHFSHAGAVQMVTFRLADSLPAEVVDRYCAMMRGKGDRAARNTLVREIEEALDRGWGACYLRHPEVARLVQDALLFFEGVRYRLVAWVVMPNHVHVVLKQLPDWNLGKIVQSWKAYTARRANALLGLEGRFWQREYFDRLVRNERHLAEVIEYIEMNPVKAGLVERPEDWPFSSAAARGSAE